LPEPSAAPGVRDRVDIAQHQVGDCVRQHLGLALLWVARIEENGAAAAAPDREQGGRLLRTGT
jgi:hypothetical protein